MRQLKRPLPLPLQRRSLPVPSGSYSGQEITLAGQLPFCRRTITTGGNTWTNRQDAVFSGGTTNAQVELGIYTSTLASSIAVGDTIPIAYTGGFSVPTKNWAVLEFSDSTGYAKVPLEPARPAPVQQLRVVPLPTRITLSGLPARKTFSRGRLTLIPATVRGHPGYNAIWHRAQPVGRFLRNTKR